MRISQSKRWLWGGVVALTGVALGWAAPQGLAVQRPLVRADAIVIMAGSGAYRDRAATAARLYRGGRAPVVVMTDEGTRGGWSQTEHRNPSFAELTVDQLERDGVPRGVVLTLPFPSGPSGSTSTLAEIEGVNRWASARGMRSLLFVTSTYHSRRVQAALSRTFGPEWPIGIETAPAPCCGALWWTSVTGWREIVGEYVKLAYQYLSTFRSAKPLETSGFIDGEGSSCV